MEVRRGKGIRFQQWLSSHPCPPISLCTDFTESIIFFFFFLFHFSYHIDSMFLSNNPQSSSLFIGFISVSVRLCSRLIRVGVNLKHNVWTTRRRFDFQFVKNSKRFQTKQFKGFIKRSRTPASSSENYIPSRAFFFVCVCFCTISRNAEVM